MKRFARISSLLFVSALIFALFARTAAFSYIGLDDAAYTFRNPFVASGLSGANVVDAFCNFRHGGIWMPVTYISYMADASFCRMTGIPLIGWMHLVNVLLHLANFLLLCRLLRMFFESPLPIYGDHGTTAVPAANCQLPTANYQLSAIMAAALLWAAHPLRAEPVAWIAARKELLWSLFSLVGILFWMGDRRRPWAYLACALACLSKPTAMCFPFLAGLVDWHSRHWRGNVSVHGVNVRRLALRYLPLVLMAVATAAIAAYSQTHVAGRPATSLYGAPLANRLVNALSAIGFYIRATVLPMGLHVDCRAVSGMLPIGAAWNLGALAVFAILALLAFLPAGKKGFASGLGLFAIGWLFFSLVPTLGVLGGFGVEAHADRFFYLPSMAFSILAAAFLQRRPAAMFPASFAVAAFAACTFMQLDYWRDDAVAHQRALACDPGHPRAMVHVADSRCSRKRDFDGGISLYRKALSLAGTVPEGGFDVADVKSRLAYALATRGFPGDFLEIKRLGAKVLSDFRSDRRGMMLDALGTAFMYDGDHKRAALLFKASVEAPDRFWPKASTLQKLKECKCQ